MRVGYADGDEVIALGLAGSRLFAGERYGRILGPAAEMLSMAAQAASMGIPAEPLTLHTSGGHTEALHAFVAELSGNLPFDPVEHPEWRVDLHAEGASAVHAAVEGLLGTVAPHRRTVAVADSSYHGPKGTSPGSPAMGGASGPQYAQAVYPAPTAHKLEPGETVDQLGARCFDDFTAWLHEVGPEIGVLLVEPQWGSSVAAQPWPAAWLRATVEAAQSFGIRVLCDEIMCGLYRHGRGGLWLAPTVGITCDAYTIGKGLGGGAFPLAAAVFADGASLDASSIGHRHTFSGASAMALETATEVLRTVPEVEGNVALIGEVMADTLGPAASDLGIMVHGQGALWGGLVPPTVTTALRPACAAHGVQVYSVGCGFMLTPPLDAELTEIEEGCLRLVAALQEVCGDIPVADWGQL